MTLTNEQKEKLSLIAKDSVLFDEKLSSYSSIRIGGIADAIVTPKSTDILKEVMQFAVDEGLLYVFLGGGCKTLVRDGGFRGIIIRLKEGFNNIEISHESDDIVYLQVGAGFNTAGLVQFASDHGFSGVECLAGVPGTVGGNIVTNAGTSEGCVGDIIEEIKIIDRAGRELTVKRKALEFSYRSLKLTRSTAIVSATLKLKRDQEAKVRESVDKLLERRKTTQPWGALTLGCVFKNIIKTSGKIKKVTSAGQVIDELGLKGVRVGRARISDKHANFIVNEGGATARDFEILVGMIKERVKEKYGMTLESEVKIIGEDNT
ncbi:MAG: UDP-N-acetylenolpyruvoylglucosamine reductase [Deltaproteobacteria bacterium CG07_land_8_20_14_0_80_38_7]|nr:MAG: UDP-N-acetylenolpyruvoylglucosamine reductase [Deltaproteobacteria bacterium CG07_land_8_20_14_0_80_38_7]